MDLILRRPLRKQRASKDAPEGGGGAAGIHWNRPSRPLRGASGRGRWAFETGSKFDRSVKFEAKTLAAFSE